MLSLHLCARFHYCQNHGLLLNSIYYHYENREKCLNYHHLHVLQVGVQIVPLLSISSSLAFLHEVVLHCPNYSTSSSTSTSTCSTSPVTSPPSSSFSPSPSSSRPESPFLGSSSPSFQSKPSISQRISESPPGDQRAGSVISPKDQDYQRTGSVILPRDQDHQQDAAVCCQSLRKILLDFCDRHASRFNITLVSKTLYFSKLELLTLITGYLLASHYPHRTCLFFKW